MTPLIFLLAAFMVAICVCLALGEPFVQSINLSTEGNMSKFAAGTPVKFTITPKLGNGTPVSPADGLTDITYAADGPASLAVASDNGSCVATPTGTGTVTVTVSAANKLGEQLVDKVTVEFVDVVKTLNLAAEAA